MNGKRVGWVLAASVLCAVSVALGGGAPERPQGWELVFEDTFDRQELGEDWMVFTGNWEMEEGALVGSGALISTRGFPGDHPDGFIRMEFEASTAVEPLILIPGMVPEVSFSDLSSFIHVQPPEEGVNPWTTGYFFQFGGFMNTQHRIRRLGRELVADRDPEIRIEQDKVHRIVVENDEGALRLFVDGQRLFEYKEDSSRIGRGFDRVGFYLHTRTRLHRVRVFVKRLPDDMI